MQQERTVCRTREPGGTGVGQLIRDIVLHHRGDISPKAETLLYIADRAHHISEVVRPALEQGDVVIQDRYIDSTVAYQGAGRTLGGDVVRDLSLWAAEGLLPDITLLFDLDPQSARRRLKAAEKVFDRLEAEKAEFHQAVRAQFLQLAANEPDRIKIIDASRSPEDVAADVRTAISALLSAPKGTAPSEASE